MVETPEQHYDNVTAELRSKHRLHAAEAEIERLSEALERIVQWSEAYPLDLFPEPDFQRAHEVLTAHGMTVDAISASAMRHVVEGAGNIARAALSPEEPESDA